MSEAQRLGVLIRQLQGRLANINEFNVGTGTATFAGGSATITVNHGLSAAPVFADAIGNTMAGGDTNRTYWSIDSVSSTQVVFRGHTPSAAVNGDITVYWWAVR